MNPNQCQIHVVDLSTYCRCCEIITQTEHIAYATLETQGLDHELTFSFDVDNSHKKIKIMQVFIQ